MRVSVTASSSNHDNYQTDTTNVSYLKGAPEVLLNLCTLLEQETHLWQNKLHEHSSQDYLTLALAMAKGEKAQQLQWLGLVLFWDPPRQEVPTAIAISATLQLLSTLVDPLSQILNVAPLPLTTLVLLLTCIVCCWILAEGYSLLL